MSPSCAARRPMKWHVLRPTTSIAFSGWSEAMAEQCITAMARDFFGYGRWDAPFWFIGPEQGQKRQESNDLGARCRIWQEMGSPEVLDIYEYHCRLGYRSLFEGPKN